MSQLPFSAAIFDLDGTLLDSMSVWSEVDRQFLLRRGFAVPADYVATIAAMSFRAAADYTIDRFSLREDPQDLMDEWLRLALEAYSHTVPLKPFAREYLLRLQSLGVRLGVATGLTVRLMEPVLKNNGIYDLFDVLCSADSVGCGKGTPEIFLHTAAKLRTAPQDCIVFEDIPQGIRSAKAAGMTAYAVYDPHTKEQDVMRREADGYLRNFSEAPLF